MELWTFFCLNDKAPMGRGSLCYFLIRTMWCLESSGRLSLGRLSVAPLYLHLQPVWGSGGQNGLSHLLSSTSLAEWEIWSVCPYPVFYLYLFIWSKIWNFSVSTNPWLFSRAIWQLFTVTHHLAFQLMDPFFFAFS